jgi:hypothetical protein
MNSLSWNHPNISQNEATSLAQQANAAETTLSVINTKGFTVNQLVLVGSLGAEDAEIVKTHASTAPTDTVITLAAALKYSHSTDTPITALDFDQIEISHATAKGGSYSILATVDMTVDQAGTTYKDAAGATTDYYKIRYKNSISGGLSGYSAEIPATGFDAATLAGMISAVFTEFSKQSDRILDRDDVARWLNEGYQKEAGQILDLGIDWYVKYGTDGNGGIISFVANQRSYNLKTLLPDYVRAKRLFFTFDGVRYVPASAIDGSYDFPNTIYSRSNPNYYFEGSNLIPKPTPTASTGGILPRYVYMPAKLANDDDVPDLPTGYETTPVNFALQKAFQFDHQMDMAKYYGDLWVDEVKTMLSVIKNRYPETPDTIPQYGDSLETDFADGFTLPS